MFSLEAFKKNYLPKYYDLYWNIIQGKEKPIKNCNKVYKKKNDNHIIKNLKKKAWKNKGKVQK